MARISPLALTRAQDASGNAVAGATLAYYRAGTSTPTAIYSDVNGRISLGTSLTSDSNGFFAVHYLDDPQDYKAAVTINGVTRVYDWLQEGANSGGSGASDADPLVLLDITALRAKTWGGNTPTLVQLVNNWTAGDNGGLFRLDATDTTTADDGGMVIVDAAGNRWKRQTERLSLRFWNVRNDGVALNRAAFVAAVTYASAAGQRLYAPAGRYRHDVANGAITLENVIIEGELVLDGGSPQVDRGTVFEIIGTSVSPFVIRRGAGFVGCQFYYPDQVDTATPTVYPATLDFDFSAGAVQFVLVERCTVFNAYDFILIDDAAGAVGHIEIRNNFIFSFRNDITIFNNLEHIEIKDNTFTYGFWLAATVAGAAKFKRENGTNILYLDGDGLIVEANLFFGSKNGILNAGGTTVLTVINGNNFDQCLNAVTHQSPSGSVAQTTISANTLLCFNGNDAALAGTAITILNTAAEDKIAITGNYFGQARSDHISISGTSAGVIELTGNVYELAGYQRAAGSYSSLSINAANKRVISVGETFTGPNTAFVNGVTCFAAALLKLVGSTFVNLQTPVSVTGATTYQAVGCTSVGTVGATSNSVAGVTGAALETDCAWDKPAFVSTRAAFAAGIGTKTYNSGSPTDITGWSETFDNGANFDPTTGVFTAPRPGRYRFSWQLFHDNTITATDRWTITLAASAGTSPIWTYRAPAADFNSLSGSTVLSLSSGTTVKLQVTRSAGAGNFVLLNDASANRFAGELL